MTLNGAESLGMTDERWRVLQDVLQRLMTKEGTPAKILYALDKMHDITGIEKMLMIYALAGVHIRSVMKLSSGPKRSLPMISMS